MMWRSTVGPLRESGSANATQGPQERQHCQDEARRSSRDRARSYCTRKSQILHLNGKVGAIQLVAADEYQLSVRHRALSG